MRGPDDTSLHASRSCSALTDEVERLRAAATSLGREKAERDVELGEALTKVSTCKCSVGCWDMSRLR